MSKGDGEVFVTFVENDDSLTNALVLAKSLRQTFTFRKILVLYGPQLSCKSRKKLPVFFDGVIRCAAEFPWMTEDWETCAKIQCWSLYNCTKCVYINCNSLVLENCDELFDISKMAVADLPSETRMDTSVMVLTPSLKKYLEIVETMAEYFLGDGMIMNIVKDLFESYLQTAPNIKLNRKYNYKIGKSQQKTPSHHSPLVPSVVQIFNVSDNKLDGFEKEILKFKESLLSEVEYGTPSHEVSYRPKAKNEPIAIVGMSCRFPSANSLDEYWKLMMEHGDGISQLPAKRFTEAFGNAANDDEAKTQAGWLNIPIDEFDEKFFGISPYELAFTDPQQRLLLELSWEAIEDAAIDMATLEESLVGIFTGVWTTNYADLMQRNGYTKRDFFRCYMGNSKGTAAGRIAHFLKSTGPNVCCESGCSSSMVAVGLACESLRKGTSDICFATGVNLIIDSFSYSDLENLVAPDGHSKTFDAEANGFGRGEGCAVLILKRLSDAVKDNDRIHGVIRGYGSCQEGTSSSMGTPTVNGEALAMQRALDDACINPKDVSFVEAHGTGTKVGDPLEMKAISKVYGGNDRKEPLMIGAGKTNIGHTESCAGIAGIIKTVLSIKHNTIPPLRHLKSLNPLIMLEEIPAIIPTEPKYWISQNGEPRIAGISSFGITGTDAHVILEEPPIISRPFKCFPADKDPLTVVTFSAKNPEALKKMLNQYEYFLKDNPPYFESLAYTANFGRTHFNHRASVLAQSNEILLSKIQDNKVQIGAPLNFENPKLCFLFTGQGSQYNGMGRKLYQQCPVFKADFDECDSILQKIFNIRIRDALWDDKEEVIHDSLYSQTSIFVIEYCLMKVWESWGVKPDMVLGHSLGEFASAVTAGCLNLQDALKLVGTRSKLISSLPTGKMIVVKANEQSVKHVLKMFNLKHPNLWLDFAAINSQEQITLSGTEEAVMKFNQFCTNSDTKTHVLNATHAFHSRTMDPILDEYRKLAQKLSYSKPTCEFISSVRGKIIENIDAQYWVDHTRESVQFINATQQGFEAGARIFLEIGPTPVLSALVHSNIESFENKEPIITSFSMKRNTEEWETILNAIGKLFVSGINLDWKSFHAFQNTEKVALPLYPFQRKSHWMDLNCRLTNKLTSKGSPQIHPLFGSEIVSPTPETVFQKFLTQKSLSFLIDHKIGNHVIFPASGYLEMSIAAGYAAIFKLRDKMVWPDTPISVHNLQIKSPLELVDDSTYEMQTVICSVESEENSTWTKAVVYSRKRGVGTLNSDNNKWICHSEAKFSCSSDDINVPTLSDLQSLRNVITDEITEDIYSRLSTVGYKFGPMFKSLKNIWKSETELLAEICVPEKNSCNYLCHPVVMDAMIQACLFKTLTTTDTLRLPISVKSFTWLKPSDETISFIHVYQNNTGEMTSVLYDNTGEALAVMCGVELVSTTLSSFESAIQSHKKAIVPLFQEIWRPQPNLRSSFEFSAPFLQQAFPDLYENAYEYKATDEEASEIKKLETIIPRGILKALLELGFKEVNVGDKIDIVSLEEELKIVKESQKMFQKIFEILVEDKWLQRSSNNINIYKVKKKIPSIECLNKELKNCDELFNLLKVDWKCTSLFMEKMPELLTGKVSALKLLFSEKNSDVNAQTFYTEILSSAQLNQTLSSITNYLAANLFSKVQNETSPSESQFFKICEVGGGTGSATHHILSELDKHKIKYRYTFTDISATFFKKAQITFKDNKSMEFATLNIEEDPKLQGFTPHQFDVVLASNCLHATKDLNECCRNIRDLMKPFGILLILETFKPHRLLDITFSYLEGYNRFTDYSIRPNHCTLDGTEWIKLLKANGFSTAHSLEVFGGKSGAVLAEASEMSPTYIKPTDQKKKAWVLFSNNSDIANCLRAKLLEEDRQVYAIKQGAEFKNVDKYLYEVSPFSKADTQTAFQTIISELKMGNIEGIIYTWALDVTSGSDKLTKTYLSVVQAIIDIKFEVQPKFFLLTESQLYVGDQDVQLPVCGPLLGLNRTFGSEVPTIFSKVIDVQPTVKTSEAADTIFYELWKNDFEALVAYRNGVRHISRLKTIKSSLIFGDLELPGSERYSIILPKTKSIADLKFGNATKRALKPDEVEVHVKAAGLNFRDIFSVLKPTADFEKSNTIGADFSGIISRVGQNATKRRIGEYVIGCNIHNNPLPSHVVLKENQLVTLPENWTFTDGATLPCAFATVYQCLVVEGNLQKDQTILIHTASGAVGLCAIQLAKVIGANIIATAGSKRKRAYLHNIGIKHVFNSRTLEFEEQIKAVTNKSGVDFVLNSITGPGFKEASLNSCKTNAVFIEMSKLSIWSLKEVAAIRPDVKYKIIDLSEQNLQVWENLMKNLSLFLNGNQLKPLASTSFSAVHIRDAMKYLERAKQIGKVVIKMPEIDINNGIVEVKLKLFNENSTYLITGGLRGIGLEVAKWMVSLGAKSLVLCAQTQPNEYAQSCIDELRRKSVIVTIIQSDIGDFDQCKQIINTISHSSSVLPPLRGIMHAAGCLSDATLPNQTWEKFETTMNPKVKGGWNLHVLTKDLVLEHFVLFSSICSILGHPGQSNHSASNAFLDALAQYRNSLGLPATSINWGHWGETGVAVDKRAAAFNPFSTAQGLNSLEHIMSSNVIQITACDADVSIWKSAFSWGKTYFEELKSENSGNNEKSLSVSSEDFWKELKSTGDSKKHHEIVERYLTKILIVTLKLDENEKIGKHTEFQELGMDSLMMIEFRNYIQAVLGSTVMLSGGDMADANTLDKLTKRIVQRIFTRQPDDRLAEEEALNNVIAEDSKLWEHIQGDGNYVKPSKVSTVFLTGVTGFLGPYMLRTLSHREHIKTVYCLVRESKEQTLLDRLTNRLIEAELLDEVNMEKVQLVSGDISQVALGMSEDVYDDLAQKVEAIVHCAVQANHLERYRKGDSKFATVRSVNVIGTQRILEFAANRRTKLVYNGSTAFASGTGVVTRNGSVVPEHWPEERDKDIPFDFGYGISKYLADRLLMQAVEERKIPCKSFRFVIIGGDSRDGRQEVKNNHFFMKFLCYLKSGMMPNLDVPLQIVPVDICADITLQVFFNDEAPFALYNVLNPYNNNETEIVKLGPEFGYETKLVPFSEFADKIEKDGSKSLLYRWKPFYTDSDCPFLIYDTTSVDVPLKRAWLSDPHFFENGRLYDLVPNFKEIIETPLDILRREIRYAVKKYDVFNTT